MPRTRRTPLVATLSVLAIALTSPLHGANLEGREDVAGSADHRMISRYPGSVIVNYLARDYDAFRMPKGPATRDGGEWAFSEAADLEGRLTRIRYAVPRDRSSLEVFRNYERSLREAGFEIGSTCAGGDCGNLAGLLPRMKDDRGTDLMGENLRHLSAVARTPEADVHVSLLVLENNINWLDGHPVVQLDVIETTPMETGLVEVDLSADEMARQIERDGHVAVYGIHFDLDSDVVKPGSRPVIAEVGRLLKARPGLSLLVVGHTDAQGDLAYNLDLSRRRAAAVVAALVDEHGIDRSRLEPHGVGYLAPVASNAGEKGRAMNRRVELVEQ